MQRFLFVAAGQGPVGSSFPGGRRRFQAPEEERTAIVLCRMGIRWEYETRQIEIIGANGEKIRSAAPDFYLSDHHLFLEVKRSDRGHRRQRQVALAAGFNFAYLYCRPDEGLSSLRQMVRACMERAQRASDYWRRTNNSELSLTSAIVRTVHCTDFVLLSA